MELVSKVRSLFWFSCEEGFFLLAMERSFWNSFFCGRREIFFLFVTVNMIVDGDSGFGKIKVGGECVRVEML